MKLNNSIVNDNSDYSIQPDLPGSIGPKINSHIKGIVSMKVNALFNFTRAALVASALVLGAVSAHAEPFNPTKFFERLAAEGNSAPKDFDSKKFFDKLAAEGNSAEKPLDAKTFFDKLKAEGNSMPKDFDSKKFFDKLAAEGNSAVMPPMVSMKK